jgi:NADH-quinone oxidoreductase subunit E
VKSTGKRKRKNVVPAEADSCAEEDVKETDVLAIAGKHDGDRGGLIAVLEGIQQKYGYLPETALRILSRATGRSLVDIYGVATFYRSFTLQRRGRHLVTACLGTACHVRAAPRIVEELERQLGIKASETTADKNFTLETVNCLGACALGPVVVIDGHYFSKVRKSQVRELLDKTLRGLDRMELRKDKRIFPIEVNCPLCDHSLMDRALPIDGHPSVRLTACFDHKKSCVRLSSLYGSHNVIVENDIPVDTVVDLFCPYCGKQLAVSHKCLICEAGMVPLNVRGGGIVQICSRRGCKGHMLDIS